MLVLRLQRTGRENLPTYRIVVAEKRRPVKGKFMEIVGHYLPANDPVVFQVKTERVEHWVAKGAVPSDTLARLLKRNGVKNMDKFIQRYAKQKSKSEQPEAPAAAPKAEAATEAVAPAAEAAPADAPAPEAAPAA